MARNKYPEQTTQKIIDVSLRLFLEKGYDHTTVQDIVDHLGGLTKGAVYHHFKSKEEIFEAVLNSMFASKDTRLHAIMRDIQLNGREKLCAVVSESFGDPAQEQLFIIAPNMQANALFLGAQIMQVQQASRQYLEPIIREGMADGSIQTDQPAELAELLLLITNFWLNPLVFEMEAAQVASKCRLFQVLLSHFGLADWISEKEIARLERYCEMVTQSRKK